MINRKVTAAAIAAPVLAAAFLAAGPAQGATGRQAIPESKPTWLAHGHRLGAAAGSAAVSGRVYLTPNGGMGALERFAYAVSTPGSAQYGHFLTPAQYFARFGTTSSTVTQVRHWLTSAGLRVTGVEAHNRYVAIRGTVKAAERAFGVTINRYRHDGYTVQAPSSALSAPSGVASSVLAVSGIDTTPQIMKPTSKPPAGPPAGFRNAPPCSTYYGEKLASDLPAFNGKTLPYQLCGYVGSQFRSAYEGGTALDGSGVTVAITDAYASPTIVKDTSTYAATNGDAPYAKGQFTQSLPSRLTHTHSCGENGWYGEETLDVEAVHAMAQGANIRYYGAASCYDADLLDAFARVNDEDVAKLVSDSWGDAGEISRTSTIAAYNQAFLQGAAEGISYMFSSGDSGDEVAGTGIAQPDFPASDPFVTAVGGTSTAINSAGQLAGETGWGTMRYGLAPGGTSWSTTGSFLYGSGGGYSHVFSQPSYQNGIDTHGRRGVPDVAMDADVQTGMLIGETQVFPNGTYYDQYKIGGTSLASPLFTGMTALAVQNAGHGVGLLDPTIYMNKASFNDVTGNPLDAGVVRVDYVNGVDAANGTVPSVRTLNTDSSLTVTPGWDDVTGLGSPGTGWLSALG